VIALASFWRSRTARERMVLAAGAGLAAVLLAVALVWLPLERERTRLAAEIPAMHASLAEMRSQADQVKQLRAAPAREASAAPLAALIASGTLAQGLPGARLSALDAKRLKLAADDVAWPRLLEWLSGAQGTHGLVAEEASVEALAAPGRVRAEIVLAAP
jgi:type II secretory pathway component PulM